jgi:hypothetical protein
LINDGRDYMSPLWLDDGKWCPKLYINRKCYAGPFIDPKRLWRLENSYGPGSLPKVLECLVSDFVTCCEGSKLMHIFDAKKLDGIFTLPAKYYSNSDNDRQHSSTNVVNFTFVGCKNVKVLPQWLNILCRMIDACPGFISTKEYKSKCIYDCSTVSTEFQYMLPDVHVNTAYSLHVSKDRAKQKKRRTIVEQLQSNSPRRRRSRIGATAEESDDEDSRSSSPIIEAIISRRRTISTSIHRPTIVRPIKPTDVSSDSSSDDDDVIAISDEEIPTLSREIMENEYNHRNGNGNNGSRYSDSPTFPSHHLSQTPSYPVAGYSRQNAMPLRPQSRTLGPKIRYASQIPTPPMFTGPIMDPRKVYQPTSRPQYHQQPNPIIRPTAAIPRQIPPSNPSIGNLHFDPATGKYKTTSSFNLQKTSPSTVSPSANVAPQPKKPDTPPFSGETFPAVNSDPRAWRVAQVSAWICKSVEKDFHLTLFNNRVSGLQLLKLTTHDLSHMGIPFGRALKLQDLIRKLRTYTELNFGNIDDAVDA